MQDNKWMEGLFESCILMWLSGFGGVWGWEVGEIKAFVLQWEEMCCCVWKAIQSEDERKNMPWLFLRMFFF